MKIRIGRIRVDTVRAADPHWSIARNIYYKGEPWETLIGFAIYLGRPGLSVRWRTPISPNEWIREGKQDG